VVFQELFSLEIGDFEILTMFIIGRFKLLKNYVIAADNQSNRHHNNNDSNNAHNNNSNNANNNKKDSNGKNELQFEEEESLYV